MLQSTRKSAWRRSALLIVAAVLVMTVMAACGNNNKGGHSLEFKGTDKGEVIATYKDGKVTKPEFDKYLSLYVLADRTYEQIITIPQFQEMILEQYISFKVVNSQASEESLKEASKEVDEQLKQFKQVKKEDKAFADMLKEKNISDEDMATFMMMSITISTHMNSLVKDEDIAATFEELKPNYAVSSVRHILVGTVETDPETREQKELRTVEEALKIAQEVKEKLDAGGDWDALAKEYSDDPGSKDKGGLYEDYPGGGWIEPFKIAAFEQEVGVVGEPVLTDFGYHVIKVEKRDIKTYDQITDEEKDQVKNAAAYSYLEKFLEEEMPKQEIDITLPEPELPAEDEEPTGEGEGNTEAETPAEDGNAEAPADGEAAK